MLTDQKSVYLGERGASHAVLVRQQTQALGGKIKPFESHFTLHSPENCRVFAHSIFCTTEFLTI